ncbi:MAG: aminotransferase class III-fold pyridoxal phosphate-dependent enzyme [Firmicutes bacterium]|nr:aminotransferase class III-fold pyridoxal phosphate-dependent enzyme [Bacillota bacterium]
MDFLTIKELENKHAVRYSARQNLCFVRGAGAKLFDSSDKCYLDMIGGSESCLGYGDTKLTAAVTAQAQKLASPPHEYYSEGHGALLGKLLNNTGFTKAALTGGAPEANLAALALIRGYLKEKGDTRQKLVIASLREQETAGGTIGVSGGAIASGITTTTTTATTNTTTAASTSGGFRRAYVRLNDFAALKKALTPSAAAFIIQPIFSDGGVAIADYDYLVNAYALCKSLNVMFFCDETRIGAGITGKKFAFEHYGIQPDVVTLSRGLGGGLPIGAALTRDAIAAAAGRGVLDIDGFGFGGASGAGPSSAGGGVSALSLAAASIVLDRLDDGLLQKIENMGEYLLSRLYKLTKYNFVLNVRGRGLLAAVELSGRIPAARVANQMEKAGYLISATDGNVLRISPPYIITKSEIDEATTVLSELFASTNI